MAAMSFIGYMASGLTLGEAISIALLIYCAVKLGRRR
jgi:hypothetical protein